MKITAETNYYEITYVCDSQTYVTNICTGVVDDLPIVLKWFRAKYRGVEVKLIRRLKI